MGIENGEELKAPLSTVQILLYIFNTCIKVVGSIEKVGGGHMHSGGTLTCKKDNYVT